MNIRDLYDFESAISIEVVFEAQRMQTSISALGRFFCIRMFGKTDLQRKGE